MQNWTQKRRKGCNWDEEIWKTPWCFSHSICLSVGLHWYSKESSSSSSTYQKTVLWSINTPWESKLFSLMALVICPETLWKWEPVWYESVVTFTREQKIRFLTFCGSAEPLILLSQPQQQRMRCCRIFSVLRQPWKNSSKKKRKKQPRLGLPVKLSLKSLHLSFFWLIMQQ